MGNTETSAVDRPNEGTRTALGPQTEIRPEAQQRQARREYVNLSVDEVRRQKERKTLETIWLKMFETEVQRWIKRNDDVLRAPTKEPYIGININVMVPPELATRMVDATSGKTLGVFMDSTRQQMLKISRNYLNVDGIHPSVVVGTETVICMTMWTNKRDDSCGCVVC
ncbi:MAG: hypothetical protein KGL39_01480 [Patescibacteria group bacterium]|nr:hypothetical protein [Patescibacteria group bacterium]